MKKKLIGIFVCMLLIFTTIIPVSGTVEIEKDVSETNRYRFGRVSGEYDIIECRDGFFRNLGICSLDKNIHFYGFSQITKQFHQVDNASDLFTPYFIGYCFNGKVNGFCLTLIVRYRAIWVK